MREGERRVPSPYYSSYSGAPKAGRPPQVLWGGYFPKEPWFVFETSYPKVECPPTWFLGWYQLVGHTHWGGYIFHYRAIEERGGFSLIPRRASWLCSRELVILLPEIHWSTCIVSFRVSGTWRSVTYRCIWLTGRAMPIAYHFDHFAQHQWWKIN